MYFITIFKSLKKQNLYPADLERVDPISGSRGGFWQAFNILQSQTQGGVCGGYTPDVYSSLFPFWVSASVCKPTDLIQAQNSIEPTVTRWLSPQMDPSHLSVPRVHALFLPSRGGVYVLAPESQMELWLALTNIMSQKWHVTMPDPVFRKPGSFCFSSWNSAST